MVERWQFIAQIVEEPLNPFWRLMYADWLEEQGECQQAERLRLRAEKESPYERCECNPSFRSLWRFLNDGCSRCNGVGWTMRPIRWLIGLDDAVDGAASNDGLDVACGRDETTIRMLEWLPGALWLGRPEVYEEDAT